jgi:hypothetical protein
MISGPVKVYVTVMLALLLTNLIVVVAEYHTEPTIIPDHIDS